MDKTYNVICDRCGFPYKNTELRKEWTGLMVCEPCYDVRHPQDFARIPRTERPLPWTRPEPEDTFITVDYIATSVGTQDTTIPDGDFGSDEL